MRSPLKLKFWRSPLIPKSFSAIAPQIEILAIAPRPYKLQCDRPSSHKYRMRSPLKLKFWRSPLVPTSFSTIASQIEILPIALVLKAIKCDRPSSQNSADRPSFPQVSVRSLCGQRKIGRDASYKIGDYTFCLRNILNFLESTH